MEKNCVHHSICIFLFHVSTFFNVFGFIGTAVLVYDLCGRYDLTWRLSTILKSHESAHFPALYGPTTFTAINFIAITFNANINADDAMKSNLGYIAHGRIKRVLTFTTLTTKKKREKANGLLIRIYDVYFTLLLYVIWTLFLSFHSMPKIFYGNNYCHLDILLMFLRKCIEHQSFFLNFFMKHIEIISYFAILL